MRGGLGLTIFMALASTIGPMAILIMGSGSRAKCTARESLRGLMVGSIGEIISMIRKKVRVSFIGLTGLLIVGYGKMGSSTARENSLRRTVRKRHAFLTRENLFQKHPSESVNYIFIFIEKYKFLNFYKVNVKFDLNFKLFVLVVTSKECSITN